jgi:hypothetical protein
MRNYAQEGWVQQLQGRRVYGHYLVSGTFSHTSAPGSLIFLSIRNPLTNRIQKHMHIVRASIKLSVDTVDDAAFETYAEGFTTEGHTVNHSTGSASSTVTNLMRSGISSEVQVASDNAGGLSGGTVATSDLCFIQVPVSQSAATGTDAYKANGAVWTPNWGPLLLTGDMGLIMQMRSGPTSPGTMSAHFELEWLESEKM